MRVGQASGARVVVWLGNDEYIEHVRNGQVRCHWRVKTTEAAEKIMAVIRSRS